MSRGFSTIYVGRVDSRTRERDLYDIFDRYGRVARVDMKRGFAFVDFDDNRDAEDAIKDMDGREVDGSRLSVEWAGRGRGGGERGGGERRGGGGGRGGDRDKDGADDRRRAGQRPDHSDHRIKLEDIPSSAHWQDLKDFCRKAGDVIFGDVDRHGGGVVEFRYAEDVERAIKELDGTNWNGHKVRVTDDSKSGGSRRGKSRSRSPRGRSRSPRRGGSRSRSPKKSSRSRSPAAKKSPARSTSRSPKKSRSPSPAKDDKNGDDRDRSPSPKNDS